MRKYEINAPIFFRVVRRFESCHLDQKNINFVCSFLFSTKNLLSVLLPTHYVIMKLQKKICILNNACCYIFHIIDSFLKGKADGRKNPSVFSFLL